MHSRRRLFLFVQIVALLFVAHINAREDVTAYYQRFAGTYAVDARGVRHSSKDYKGSPPWLADLIAGVAPDYSYWDRAAHRQGRGFFLLIVDLRTGTVESIRVAQSTGFKSL